MLQRILLLAIVMVVVEVIAVAQCRPGYTGSGYYRSSSCGEYLIPKAPVLGSDVFYSDPRIFPVPQAYGYPYSQPVIVLPPQIPSWYFRPWYFEPPAHTGQGSGYYSAPPPGFPTGVRPHGMYGYPSPRGLGSHVGQPGRIMLGGDGVWTNQ